MDVKENRGAFPLGSPETTKYERRRAKSASLTRRAIPRLVDAGSTGEGEDSADGNSGKCSKSLRSFSCSRGTKKSPEDWISAPQVPKTTTNLGVRRPPGPSAKEKKAKRQAVKSKVGFLEFTHSVLSLAVTEVEEVLDILRLAMKANAKQQATGETSLEDKGSKERTNAVQESLDACFANSSKNLNEILQAWIHLFHFIFNLRFNVIRLANASGVEQFVPNALVESCIVTQAIESIKFFSKLKIRSVSQSLEELKTSTDPEYAEPKVEFEKKVLIPFLAEMDYIGKKAREMLSGAKFVRKSE